MKVVRELFKYLLLAGAIIGCSTMTLMVDDFGSMKKGPEKQVNSLRDENGGFRVPATTYKRQQTRYKAN